MKIHLRHPRYPQCAISYQSTVPKRPNLTEILYAFQLNNYREDSAASPVVETQTARKVSTLRAAADVRVEASRAGRDADHLTTWHSRLWCSSPRRRTFHQRNPSRHSRRNPRTTCSRTTDSPADNSSSRQTTLPSPYPRSLPVPSTGRQPSSPSPVVRQPQPLEQTSTWNFSQ